MKAILYKVILSTRVVCSWCGNVQSDDGQGGPDTHTICKKCEKDNF